MHLQLLVTHASGVGSLRFSRTEVSSCSLQGSRVERWCWQPTLIIFDLKLVPRIQSASLGGGSPGPFPACCELIRKPIENVMKSNMKTECMSRPIGSAKQINGIKSIVRKAPPKAGNDFLVKVKAAVAVRYFGLLLSCVQYRADHYSCTTTDQKCDLECSEMHLFKKKIILQLQHVLEHVRH